MAYPDPRRLYVLHTDASESGLGAVLYQEQDKVLRVIAYGLRTLTPAEKNYYLHSDKLDHIAYSAYLIVGLITILVRLLQYSKFQQLFT